MNFRSWKKNTLTEEEIVISLIFRHSKFLHANFQNYLMKWVSFFGKNHKTLSRDGPEMIENPEIRTIYGKKTIMHNFKLNKIPT